MCELIFILPLNKSPYLPLLDVIVRLNEGEDEHHTGGEEDSGGGDEVAHLLGDDLVFERWHVSSEFEEEEFSVKNHEDVVEKGGQTVGGGEFVFLLGHEEGSLGADDDVESAHENKGCEGIHLIAGQLEAKEARADVGCQ